VLGSIATEERPPHTATDQVKGPRSGILDDKAAGVSCDKGHNGPILPLCQDPCVEWLEVGSNLLPCLGNEMSVLTLCLGNEMSVLTLYPDSFLTLY